MLIDPNEDASPSLSTYDDSLAALGDAHNNPTQTVPATNDLAQAPSITAPGATKDRSTVFRHQHWHVRVNSHLEVFILAVEAIPYSKKVGTVDMIALANECH